LKRGSAALKRREILRLRGPADFPANPSGHFAQNDEMLGELLVRLRGGDAAGRETARPRFVAAKLRGTRAVSARGPGYKAASSANLKFQMSENGKVTGETWRTARRRW